MSRNSMRRAAVATVFAAWLFAGAGLAVGQDKPAPPLQGPKVTPNRPPELEDEFAPGKRDKFQAREPGVRMMAYAEIINKMKGESAPAEVRLSAEQESKVQAIMEDFKRASREFAQKNGGGQGDRPARKAPNAPQNPDGDKNQDEMTKPGAPPAGEGNERQRRQRLEEMRKDAPKPVDYQGKIWNVLNEPQQTFVKGELDKIRVEREKQQDEQYMRRELEKRKAKDGKGGDSKDAAPARPEQPGGGPPPEVRERVQRVFEKLRGMSPEEREKFLRFIEEELDRRSGADNQKDDAAPPPPRKPAGDKPGKAGQRRIRPGGGELPPPPIDDVKVPRPEGKP